MRKHSTPPWRVDWDTDIASVKAANGKAVARCYQGDDDAKLIAAAPDLLIALVGLLEDHKRMFPEAHPNSTIAWSECVEVKAAQAAIDKATK